MRTALSPFVASILLVGCAAPKPEPQSEPQVVASPSQPHFTQMSYPSREGRTLTLEVYPPDATKNLHRGVILIHGGGWVSGARSEMAGIGNALSKEGFTGFSIDYTLAPKKIWPAQLEDAQAAVRFVRSRAKEFDIDPLRLAAAGVSAGGHLSMFLGTTDAPEKGISSKVQAVCSISGIHDLNQPMTAAGDRYGIVEALMGELGKPNKEARRKASPVEHVTKTSAPTLFVQGSADPLVPRAQSDRAMKKLTDSGVDTKEIIVNGMGHGIQPTTSDQQRALAEIALWLKTHLSKK